MSKWFYNVFLPSLFDRTGANNQTWLSAKQTAICTDNMQVGISRRETADGFQNHKFYSTTWNGRNVRLDYSSLNGCGCIVFSYNKEEQEKANEEAKQESNAKKTERIKRLFVKHPEKYQEKLEKMRLELEEMKADNAEDIQDGLITKEEADRIEKELQDEIEMYLSVV